MATKISKINKTSANKKVLIAPLDWGLGHATRCIPVINEFIVNGYEVLLGAEKETAALLQKEFPALKILTLRGYRVSYSRSKTFFFIKMLSQFFKIRSAIKYERSWLANTIKAYGISIVVSDNRFGLYHKAVKSIFITHQLAIKTGNRFTDKIAQKINYTFINRFDECWVPDEPGKNNLAAELSHPRVTPTIPLRYIGKLSRFKNYDLTKTIDLVILLSGPEPQRTIFENLLLPQLKSLQIKTVLVRGLPAVATNNLVDNIHIKAINHLAAAPLNELLLSCNVVLARSGYSTVMDLASIQQKAILVPTPGQTEQEYLAAYLAANKYCIAEAQAGFNLAKALQKAESTTLLPFPAVTNEALKTAINAL